MSTKKEVNIPVEVLEGEEFEVKVSKHGSGKFCSRCGKRKQTKKVGNEFLCASCRKEDKDD